MGKQLYQAKDLKHLAFPSDAAKSVALNVLSRQFKHAPREQALATLAAVLRTPDSFTEFEEWAPLLHALRGKKQLKKPYEVHSLRREGGYQVFGRRFIQDEAMRQMSLAMMLPVAERGALMPDAHHGYGLPIGGVLATRNAVIPYAVGMDIGCRMALTVFDRPASWLTHKRHDIEKALRRYTHFGNSGGLEDIQDHPILEHPHFQDTALTRRLRGKAVEQLGSSGTGNHFVEFGTVALGEENTLGLPAGTYTGLLTHSGSRGFGAAVAAYYTRVAMDTCKLPREVQSLAWLGLDTEAGQEYWRAMNLAGLYAQACHDRIHENLQRVLGLMPLLKVENHHNFAWEETHNGQPLIVHRKGATPAAEGELGIIPGSMATPGYIVRGRGNAGSLSSASHGAGRAMSRQDARERVSRSGMMQALQQQGITLIGGSPEEAPSAYKDIATVMAAQTELVAVEGSFLPAVVRMYHR